MLLSALLGTLGSVSLMAQSTNVYSLNAVGYINVTIDPGYNIISCPLIASPDNTINTLLTNGTGQFKGFKFLSGGTARQAVYGNSGYSHCDEVGWRRHRNPVARASRVYL